MEIYTFYIPNAFTPNNDTKNDTWLPKFIGVDLRNYECTIYDRWGNLIFTTCNPNIGWNGTKDNNGTYDKVVMDIYVYHIKLKEISGTKHEYIGRIALIP